MRAELKFCDAVPPFTSVHAMGLLNVRLFFMSVIHSHVAHRWSRLDGNTPSHKRHKIVTEFNKDPSKFVFLISTKAGGTGLNLQVCVCACVCVNVVVRVKQHQQMSLVSRVPWQCVNTKELSHTPLPLFQSRTYIHTHTHTHTHTYTSRPTKLFCSSPIGIRHMISRRRTARIGSARSATLTCKTHNQHFFLFAGATWTILVVKDKYVIARGSQPKSVPEASSFLNSRAANLPLS